MLPAAHRLRSSADFTEVVRRGRRAGRGSVTVHLLLPVTDTPTPVRAGFVVSKAVGGSVVRHAVARRLRHLVRARLGGLPPGARLVVRAAPGAAMTCSADLGADLDGALARVIRP